MTNHRKNRITRRSQKGGFSLFNPGTWFNSSEPEDPNKKTVLDSTKEVLQSGVNSTENFIGTTATSATNVVSNAAGNVKDSVLGLFSSNDTPPSTSSTTIPQTTIPQTTIPQTTIPQTNGTSGGRRRRRAKSMKGGKGGLGLTYYASPVSGLKVAEPTTWQYYANGTNQYSVKGGSRKRRGRKTRRTRRHKKR